MINHTDYAAEIVKNLEKRGESMSFIIGFLQATLNGLRFLENDQFAEYLKRTVKQTKEVM